MYNNKNPRPIMETHKDGSPWTPMSHAKEIEIAKEQLSVAVKRINECLTKIERATTAEEIRNVYEAAGCLQSDSTNLTTYLRKLEVKAA